MKNKNIEIIFLREKINALRKDLKLFKKDKFSRFMEIDKDLEKILEKYEKIYIEKLKNEKEKS
jgi:ribosomal protein S15P/S13E